MTRLGRAHPVRQALRPFATWTLVLGSLGIATFVALQPVDVIPGAPVAVAEAAAEYLPPADPRREAVLAAADWWRWTEHSALEALARDQWFHALSLVTAEEGQPHLRHARAVRLAAVESQILAAAVRLTGDGHDGGLHAVFREAVRVRGDGTSSPQLYEAADRAIAWGSAKALQPYGEDRRQFARAYRAVRFGSGRLDAPPTAPVRRFEFAEAAARLERTLETCRTWCYERRVRAKCRELREFQDTWATTLTALAPRIRAEPPAAVRGLLDDVPAGGRVTLDPDRPPDAVGFGVVVEDAAGGVTRRRLRWAELPASRTLDAVVLPRITELSPYLVLGLANLFAEMGEVRAASACLAHAASRTGHSPGALERELAALSELEAIAGRTIPADVRDHPALEAWSDRNRDTDIAHAIGGLGVRDIGTFDAAAVEAYLQGGLVWAPEQWAVRGERLARATDAAFDGTPMHQVRSEHFDVLNDFSAEFAADASLVLDAAYEQIAAVLGGRPGSRQRAIVFANKETYRARFGDHSGGCWVPSERALFAYLHDPGVTEFSRFHYTLLTHEAAHAALDAATQDSPPSWMHEGIACYFERWNPTRSIAENERVVGSRLDRRTRLVRAHADGVLPDLPGLLSIRGRWDVDDFGPRTLARYAAAESVFVHLMTDPMRRRIVDRFLADVNAGRDPAASLSEEERDRLASSWREFVRLE